MAIEYNNPKIVTDGLVLALDAANPKSYPGSGTTLSDLSGNSNDGTLTNGPTFDSGNSGSFVFDGVDDYVNLPLNFWNHDNGDPFTCGVWFSTSSYGMLFAQQNQATPGTASGWVPSIYVDSIGKVRYEGFWTGSGNHFVISSDSYNDGNWHYVVGMRDANVKKLYIDGNYIDETGIVSASSYSSNYYYFLGGGKITARTTSPKQFFEGNISNFTFYNRALTADEIAQNFNATRGRFGI